MEDEKVNLNVHLDFLILNSPTFSSRSSQETSPQVGGYLNMYVASWVVGFQVNQTIITCRTGGGVGAPPSPAAARTGYSWK